MTVTSLKFDLPLAKNPRIIDASAVSRHDRRHEFYRLEKVCYRVERLWCLNLFLGEGELRVNDTVIPIRSGYAGITRPNVDLEYRYTGPATLSWVHFAPEADVATVPVPAMMDLGDRFEEIRTQVQAIATCFPVQPAKAEALLWALLWRLTDLARPNEHSSRLHPALARALEIINLHLRDELSITGLARDVGLSQNHLNRLFDAEFKTTAADYLRTRRVRRAEHLLSFSNIPMKAIAAETGFKDLQHFSHVVRRVTGLSPRQIRFKVL